MPVQLTLTSAAKSILQLEYLAGWGMIFDYVMNLQFEQIDVTEEQVPLGSLDGYS